MRAAGSLQSDTTSGSLPLRFTRRKPQLLLTAGSQRAAPTVPRVVLPSPPLPGAALRAVLSWGPVFPSNAGRGFKPVSSSHQIPGQSSEQLPQHN